MKQQILERARSTVEAFLHQQCAGTTLSVQSVRPEVDGYGDELIWIRLAYDDGNDANGPLEPLAQLKLIDRLCIELRDAEVGASPVVSFIAESEVGKEPR